MYVTKNKYIYPRLDVVFFCIIGFPNTDICHPHRKCIGFLKKKVYLKIKSDEKFIFKIPVLSVSLIKDGHILFSSPYIPVPLPRAGLSK